MRVAREKAPSSPQGALSSDGRLSGVRAPCHDHSPVRGGFNKGPFITSCQSIYISSQSESSPTLPFLAPALLSPSSSPPRSLSASLCWPPFRRLLFSGHLFNIYFPNYFLFSSSFSLLLFFSFPLFPLLSLFGPSLSTPILHSFLSSPSLAPPSSRFLLPPPLLPPLLLSPSFFPPLFSPLLLSSPHALLALPSLSLSSLVSSSPARSPSYCLSLLSSGASPSLSRLVLSSSFRLLLVGSFSLRSATLVSFSSLLLRALKHLCPSESRSLLSSLPVSLSLAVALLSCVCVWSVPLLPPPCSSLSLRRSYSLFLSHSPLLFSSRSRSLSLSWVPLFSSPLSLCSLSLFSLSSLDVSLALLSLSLLSLSLSVSLSLYSLAPLFSLSPLLSSLAWPRRCGQGGGCGLSACRVPCCFSGVAPRLRLFPLFSASKARGDHNSRHLLALARHYQRRHRRWSGMMSRGIKQRDVRPAWNSRKYIHQAGRHLSRA
ncbi:hypothetical protein C7M84_018201 [Penaeus vannamei]|uniref:Uncharacterized protein n=1 Tax=Penaeus vannamei TaxID=6689 RepID=A0A423SIA3_PENVA|nr:hypothetical protein C7M84_018201 [Penaeus vannamei]